MRPISVSVSGTQAWPVAASNRVVAVSVADTVHHVSTHVDSTTVEARATRIAVNAHIAPSAVSVNTQGAVVTASGA